MAVALKGSSLNLVQGILGRPFLLRVIMLVSAMAAFPFLFVSNLDLMEFFAVDSGDCMPSESFAPGKYLKPFTFYALPSFGPSPCQADVNFTYAVFRGLMDVNLLSSGSKALCAGEKSGAAVSALRKLGFSDAVKADRGRAFSVMQMKGLVDELAFEGNSFDFVFSRGLNRASVPALHVLEIERVLKPGGIGALLDVVANAAGPSGMIKAATPVSSFLKCSDIVYVGMIDGFALAVFKKKTDSLSSFEHLQLPKECPSVTNSKPFSKFLEPLLDNDVHTEESELKVAYLTKFMNIFTRKKLVYIDVGAGGYINSSIANWFLPLYPKQSRRMDIYALEHDSSVLTSYAAGHGVTFVYYPVLSEKKPAIDYDLYDESGGSSSYFDNDDEMELFDFLSWFKGTVRKGDFVVLKMNVGAVGLRDLLELVESGAICMVDELFLHCPDNGDVTTSGNCLQMFKDLRRMGIYVHQYS